MAEMGSEELGWINDDTEDVEVDSENTTPHTKDDRSHFREQMRVARSRHIRACDRSVTAAR